MQWPEGTVYSGDGNDLQPQKNQIQFELQIHRGYKHQIIINLQPTPDILTLFKRGTEKKTYIQLFDPTILYEYGYAAKAKIAFDERLY